VMMSLLSAGTSREFFRQSSLGIQNQRIWHEWAFMWYGRGEQWEWRLIQCFLFLLVPSRSSNLTLAFLCCKTTNSTWLWTRKTRSNLT
jgi:hypothetical protein